MQSAVAAARNKLYVGVVRTPLVATRCSALFAVVDRRHHRAEQLRVTHGARSCIASFCFNGGAYVPSAGRCFCAVRACRWAVSNRARCLSIYTRAIVRRGSAVRAHVRYLWLLDVCCSPLCAPVNISSPSCGCFEASQEGTDPDIYAHSLTISSFLSHRTCSNPYMIPPACETSPCHSTSLQKRSL